MMGALTFRIPWLTDESGRAEPVQQGEWLLTNGLGSYASAVLTGQVTRRYHGLLVAAVRQASARRVMLSQLEESLRFPDGRTVHFGMGEHVEPESKHRHAEESGMTEFRLELGLPAWRFEFADAVLEKDLLLVDGQNTLVIRYRLLESSAEITLLLRPLLHFRDHSDPVDSSSNATPTLGACDDRRCEVHDHEADAILRLRAHGAETSFCQESVHRAVFYSLERVRGDPAFGNLSSPGVFSLRLKPGESAALTVSTEPWAACEGVQPDEAFALERKRREDLLAAADPRIRAPGAQQLVLAADQFIIRPKMRSATADGPAPEGVPGMSILAGYHWFTDWGRDTMISLEGLALLTGRFAEARSTLQTFAGAVRDGLIPNLFPEGDRQAVYHSADASLWFFHAVDRYLETTRDASLVAEVLPTLRGIVEHYRRGTKFGIGVDPADGLVRQGDPHHPLTWMDAQVGDWIVTPRRGKTVEINAMWYNALRLLESWLREVHDEAAARDAANAAEQVWRSFNARFWFAEGGYLYDVVDGEQGDDSLCRPNQIFALSLRHPVLDPQRWGAVFETVRERLLTPVGLRTLAPGSPGYHPVYFGDRRARDAAYHQGAVWPWLLGPYVDVWMRLAPEDRAVAHQFLQGTMRSLGEACIGSLSEIYDAEEPHTPRGCIAQAWSVAEVVRACVGTMEEPSTDKSPR